MTGQELVKILDIELAERGMSQKDFCNALGIGSSAMSAWRKGSMPTPKRIADIEKLLGIRLADYEKPDMNDETAEVLEWFREDFSHRALFESAKGLTAEQSYAVASYIEKLKSGDK